MFKKLYQGSESIRGDEVEFPQHEIERIHRRLWILDHAKKGGVGAEIGVFRGHFSEPLGRILQPRVLYLVDPWTKLGETFGWGEDSAYTGYGKLTTRYAYLDTLRRVRDLKDVEVRAIEAYAGEFIARLEEQLDWVYLDASHDYQSTLNELKMIDDVLVQDGVILGDDWQPARNHIHHGVFRAVHEFIRTRRYEIVAAGPAAQWCIRRAFESAAAAHGAKKTVADNHPWILYAKLDDIDQQAQTPGKPLSLGGVVVLSREAPSGAALWVTDAGGPRKIDWGLPSPWAATQHPEGVNCTHARFKLNDARVAPGRPLSIELHCLNGEALPLLELRFGK